MRRKNDTNYAYPEAASRGYMTFRELAEKLKKELLDELSQIQPGATPPYNPDPGQRPSSIPKPIPAPVFKEQPIPKFNSFHELTDHLKKLALEEIGKAQRVEPSHSSIPQTPKPAPAPRKYDSFRELSEHLKQLTRDEQRQNQFTSDNEGSPSGTKTQYASAKSQTPASTKPYTSQLTSGMDGKNKSTLKPQPTQTAKPKKSTAQQNVPDIQDPALFQVMDFLFPNVFSGPTMRTEEEINNDPFNILSLHSLPYPEKYPYSPIEHTTSDEEAPLQSGKAQQPPGKQGSISSQPQGMQPQVQQNPPVPQPPKLELPTPEPRDGLKSDYAKTHKAPDGRYYFDAAKSEFKNFMNDVSGGNARVDEKTYNFFTTQFIDQLKGDEKDRLENAVSDAEAKKIILEIFDQRKAEHEQKFIDGDRSPEIIKMREIFDYVDYWLQKSGWRTKP